MFKLITRKSLLTSQILLGQQVFYYIIKPSQLFEGHSEAFLISFYGRLLASPANNRPGYESLPSTTALAYIDFSSMTKKKLFTTLTTGQSNFNHSDRPNIDSLC
jgi:hypothetical protein